MFIISHFVAFIVLSLEPLRLMNLLEYVHFTVDNNYQDCRILS